jgi:energy-converting hydrogenase Eha subunit A
MISVTGPPTYLAALCLVAGLVLAAFAALALRPRTAARLPRAVDGPAPRPPRALALTALIAGTLLAVGGTAGLILTDDPVRNSWESRAPFASCGEVSLSHGDEMPIHATTEIGCLRRALEQARGAELEVRYRTVEGDPIRDHYRLTPRGALEVYTDSTEDRYSDGTWSFAPCHRPDWLPEIACPGPAADRA